MSRISIELPDSFNFSVEIPIRITDINYGGHVGNDVMLRLLHDARLQYLGAAGLSELDFAGKGLIMSDAALSFKKEVFYGDQIRIWVKGDQFAKINFTLFYKMEKLNGEKWEPALHAKTGMVCYDYELKKVTALPVDAIQKLSAI